MINQKIPSLQILERHQSGNVVDKGAELFLAVPKGLVGFPKLPEHEGDKRPGLLSPGDENQPKREAGGCKLQDDRKTQDS